MLIPQHCINSIHVDMQHYPIITHITLTMHTQHTRLHAPYSLCSCYYTTGGLEKLEWHTEKRGLSIDHWLSCKKARHNVLQQQTEEKLRTLYSLQARRNR